MKKKLIIILGLLLLCVVGVITIKSIYYNPNAVFKRIFDFELPSSVVIKNHEYHENLFLENEFYLKSLLSENDYITIEKELSDSSQNGLMKMTQEDIIPNIQNVCSWWDMNKDEILVAYQAFDFGKITKTKMLYVFLTQNANGEYYLYIAN